MILSLPAPLKPWIDEHKPTDHEMVFLAAMHAFARMYGVETYQEWNSADVKSMAKPNTTISMTYLTRLKEQGIIEIVNGLDESVTIRFTKGLIPNSSINTNTIKHTLTDIDAIITFSYFLGRIAHINQESDHIVNNVYSPRAYHKNGKLKKTAKPKESIQRLVLDRFYLDGIRLGFKKHALNNE